MNIQNSFKEYEDLKIQSKKIEERIKELKPIITPHVGEEGVTGHQGVFTLKPYITWEYSEVVEDMGKKLEDMKAEEKATGVAKEVSKNILFYKQTTTK